MSPIKVAGFVLVGATVLALVQTRYADRPGKRLALASIRSQVERLPKDDLIRQAIALKGKIGASGDLDDIFRDVTLVWAARSPSGDLTRPTIAEAAAIPIGEAVQAVRRLTPATGFEGGRIRALYEARSGKERDQMGILARILNSNPNDAEVLRAYASALRKGRPEELRKATELARAYAVRTEGSALSRLTLLLVLSESKAAKDAAEAKTLGEGLLPVVPKESSAYEATEAAVRRIG